MIKVGQKLRDERVRRGLSLDDVAKATRIRSSFLQAIEKDEFQKLPSSAYAQGFVRNYAEFLNLPKKEMLALFRREYDEERAYRVLPQGFGRKERLPVSKFRIHHRVFIVLAVLFLVIGYVLFQYRYAIITPPLTVTSPKADAVLSQRELVVTGKTDQGATVTVNDQAVTVDSSGGFSKSLALFSGETMIVVKAKHRLGKEAVVQRKVTVRNN